MFKWLRKKFFSKKKEVETREPVFSPLKIHPDQRYFRPVENSPRNATEHRAKADTTGSKRSSNSDLYVSGTITSMPSSNDYGCSSSDSSSSSSSSCSSGD